MSAGRSKMDSKQQDNERFLSDQPLKFEDDRQESFGHDKIADSLRSIVLGCNPPFTIGLFAKWGTGKTTILNLLKGKLVGDDIAVVDFDVWKHSGDALRRTFLRDTYQQLLGKNEIPKDKKLTKKLRRLGKSISTTTEGEIKINFQKLHSLLKYFIFTILIVVITGFLVGIFFPDFFETYVSAIAGGSIVSVLIIWLLQKIVTATITTPTETESVDPFKDPYEFERGFKDILEHLEKEKLLVLVDNLDRSTHERAVEVLSTIKTFLEQKQCIFIIACDHEAIKKHLKSVYTSASENQNSYELFDADEFLRKFFNTYVCIPDFIDTELQTYTEALLKETGVLEFNDPEKEVSYIITRAFRDNPRQIKQFINTLLAHYMIAKKREEGEKPLIPDKIVTKNIDFYAKLLAIREKYSDLYKQIIERQYSSAEINKLVDSEENFEGDSKEFLVSTLSVPKNAVKNTRPFIYLKLSKEEMEIANHDVFEQALKDHTEEIVYEEFKKLKKSPELVEKYGRFIVDMIDKNAHRPTPLFNIIVSSLEGLEAAKIEFPGLNYYELVANYLGTELKDKLNLIKPELVFNQIIGKCCPRWRQQLLRAYLEILESQSSPDKIIELQEKWEYELFDIIVKNLDLFRPHKEKIQKILEENYYDNIGLLSIIASNEEAQKILLTKILKLKIVETLSEQDLLDDEILNKKINLLMSFGRIEDIEIIEQLISVISAILKKIGVESLTESEIYFLNLIEKIVVKYQKIISDLEEETLKNFTNSLKKVENAMKNWEEKAILMPIYMILTDILSEPITKNIHGRITNFWMNAKGNSIKEIFDRQNKTERNKILDKYWNNFYQRLLRDREIFNLIWMYSNKDKKKQMFEGTIESGNYKWGLNKLQEEEYRINFKKFAVKKILQYAKSSSLSQKNELFEAVNNMNCGSDAKLRNIYYKQIKQLLCTQDINHQKVGYEALKGATLSKSLQRDLAHEVIKWLKNQNNINSAFEFSLKSITSIWKSLERIPKKEYINIIFRDILIPRKSKEDIDLGIKLLKKTKPDYKDNEILFTDLLESLETENDESIKSKIIKDLSTIYPNEINLEKS
ncbi:MAG: P-loop NTPase fold protein [Candidatus Aenigmatarchaeota archaeon]